MVLCLVTLIDLLTHRAGLSALSELLFLEIGPKWWSFFPEFCVNCEKLHKYIGAEIIQVHNCSENCAVWGDIVFV